MNTVNLIEALRADIKRELQNELLAELQPIIEKQLHANVFNSKEAMYYLKVSESTLRLMVKEEEIPFFRQRGNLFFRQLDLDKHIASIICFGSL